MSLGKVDGVVIESIGKIGSLASINIGKVGGNDVPSSGYIIDPAYCKLLSHFDGSNGATSYTAETGQVVTFSGDAQLAIAQKKFGASSAYFDGSGNDWISIPASSDFNFGTGAFTIDFWIYKLHSNIQDTLLSSWQDYNAIDNWYFYVSGDNKLGLYPSGYQQNHIGIPLGPLMSGTTNITQNAFHHVAYTFDGSVCRIFLGGHLEASLTTSAGSNSDQAVIFGINSGNFSSQPFYGYMDELRISKGVCEWTSDFTPPTLAYVFS